MMKIRNYIKRLSKFQKVICIILMFFFISTLLLSVGIPTLARYKNRTTTVTASAWNGNVAISYKEGNGTIDNPYIISDGSELAYFYTQLLSNNYENTYFALSNDIMLNEGILNYNLDNGIEYILNNQVYYVDQYTNKYYDNVDRTGTEIGTINIFNSLDGFKGYFDGNLYTIYGLYITNENSEELALFTDLYGNIHDLYVENSIVYGGTITAGIASTTNNASLSNVLFSGDVVGKSTGLTKNINTTPSASVINIQNTEITNPIDLTSNIPFVGSEIVSTSISGNYTLNGSDGTDTSIKINGVTVTNGSFEIDLGTSIVGSIPVVTSTTSENAVTLTFSNLSYNISYNYAVSGGIAAICNNTTIENTINKSSVYGYSVSGGLVGVTTNLININQSYNVGDITSQYVSGGLVGTIEKSSNDIAISKSYNTGNMNATNIGGLIGVISNNSGSVTISKVFNTSTTNYSIGTIANTTVNVNSAYFVNGATAVNNGSINGSFTLISIDDLKTKSYVINNLSFNEFISIEDIVANGQNVWVYENNSLPILFIQDNISDGYKETFIIGRNASSYLDADPYITNKSTITLNLSYSNFPSGNLSGYTHNLISNTLLPIGTKITLIDNITNMVYKYTTTAEEDVIPFALFKEVGTGTIDKFYTESTYYDGGIINEDFTIVLDLFNTNISTNHNNVILYMELHDTNDNSVRSTLYNTIKEFNIYSNVNSEDTAANLNLTTDYSGGEIVFNSDSSTDININSGINYKYINDFRITDTTYENKEMGVSIKLVDINGNTVNKEYLKNVVFKVENSIYHPEADNIIRISMKNGIADVSKTLTIITGDNDNNLEEGTYYFKISNYVSYDGYYYDQLGSTELSIPVNVSDDKTDTIYSFDVVMEDSNRIISKANNEVEVLFKVLQNGSLENPNIRVSLYKKNLLTAYDQNYSLVDLSDYVSNTLILCEGKTYYVSTAPVQYESPSYLYNNFALNLITSSFENTGYKFVFDLYDGDKKIGTVEKHFIVKWREI